MNMHGCRPQITHPQEHNSCRLGRLGAPAAEGTTGMAETGPEQHIHHPSPHCPSLFLFLLSLSTHPFIFSSPLRTLTPYLVESHLNASHGSITLLFLGLSSSPRPFPQPARRSSTPAMPASTPLYALAAAIMSGVALGAADHWILTHAQTIALARMDPIVNPSAISTHVHNIVGASNFDITLNSVSDQLNAACSSTIVNADISNYWAPQLYYHHQNVTFSPIMSGTRVYYFTKGTEVKPFPQGLRMIAGAATTRDLSDTKAFGVRISCDHGEDGFYLPNGTTHPGGCSLISTATYFPSCGLSTGDLDSTDHFSHMAWPQSYNGTVLVDDANGQYCPDTHPLKYPTIFAQWNYYLDDNQPWRNDEGTIVFSNGDTLGSSMHADFVNGWTPDVLADAISQCGDGNGPEEDLTACAPLAKSTNESATWDCRLEGKIPDEDVGLQRPIDKLPGCNPLWTADVATKPTCDETASDPSMFGPNVLFENLIYRWHVPMAAAFVTITSDLAGLTPSLGNTGDSRLVAWGSEGSDTSRMTVGTLEEIIAGAVGAANGSSSTAESSTASTTASTASDVSSTLASATATQTSSESTAWISSEGGDSASTSLMTSASVSAACKTIT
ncbi:hypothetical protein, variant [Cryptococcus amylolentus CBS 6039]|uniref:DUF1996 domain-containing protein n=1 Tax=Cryptococcus amylolentus CBS 6039 TaxID=1295533 RepID=A0A1E3HKS1_9TREE|nr:hypothetical protein, variant [Cryptococcus amylolentus CBS 6039]ODN76938.1 hypothetical protein, variant [Cryptococcus amylolentus CBS 6039]